MADGLSEQTLHSRTGNKQHTPHLSTIVLTHQSHNLPSAHPHWSICKLSITHQLELKRSVVRTFSSRADNYVTTTSALHSIEKCLSKRFPIAICTFTVSYWTHCLVKIVFQNGGLYRLVFLINECANDNILMSVNLAIISVVPSNAIRAGHEYGPRWCIEIGMLSLTGCMHGVDILKYI